MHVICKDMMIIKEKGRALKRLFHIFLDNFPNAKGNCDD